MIKTVIGFVSNHHWTKTDQENYKKGHVDTLQGTSSLCKTEITILNTPNTQTNALIRLRPRQTWLNMATLRVTRELSWITLLLAYLVMLCFLYFSVFHCVSILH